MYVHYSLYDLCRTAISVVSAVVGSKFDQTDDRTGIWQPNRVILCPRMSTANGN